jgi:hypothetical protein
MLKIGTKLIIHLMKSYLDDGSSDASWSIVATVLLAKTVNVKKVRFHEKL